MTADTRDYPVPAAPVFLSHDAHLLEQLEQLGVEVRCLLRYGIVTRPPRTQSERILSMPTPALVSELHERCSPEDLHALASTMREMADALEPATRPITALEFHNEVRAICVDDAPVSIDVTADESGVLRLAVTTTGTGAKPGGTYRARGATQRQLLDGLRDYFPDA